MKKLTLTVTLLVSSGTEKQVIQERVKEQLEKITNPHREDMGIKELGAIYLEGGAPLKKIK